MRPWYLPLMDEPGGNYAQWNKPDRKKHTAWSHLHKKAKRLHS